MQDPSEAMQLAVVTALKASAAVKALIGDPARVFDKVDPSAQHPFIRVGDDQVLISAHACDDGWQVYVTLHIFSRGEGAKGARPEVKAISNAAVGVLGDEDAPIAITGFVIAMARFHTARTFLEADGVTAHGVTEFEFLVGAG
jgi:hypothetical protein